MYPTIVTMIYDIRKMENNTGDNNRTASGYIELAKNYILKLPYPLVVFIDNNEKEIYDAIYSEREAHNLLHLTYIYQLDFKETYFYKDLSKLEELHQKFCIRNGNLNHETPLYVILNNNKFCFIERTIELNPFNSSHFIWMDFGINHVAVNNEYIHEWITKVPDKIKQLCINPASVKIIPEDYSDNCPDKRVNPFIFFLHIILPGVSPEIQRENYELFDFFYGDYEGIISNYLKPLHSWWLINLNIEKCLNMNSTKYLYNILIYLISCLFIKSVFNKSFRSFKI